jgi:DNA polymerase III subunit delta'
MICGKLSYLETVPGPSGSREPRFDMWRVIGQDRIVSVLDYSLRYNTIAHAYLITGPRHIGKGALAVNLAQALNCEASEAPCGECRSCQRIVEGKHADVTLLGLSSGTEIGIDDIRGLQRLANLPPYEGKCKVFIIDDAECLSTEASNALLKVLEEPPPAVVWLLLAADADRLLPTIVSRCQRLELKPVPARQVQEVLVHSYNVEPEKAKLLAELSHGCLGWALSALADDAILEQRSQRIARLCSLLSADLEQRFGWAQELAAKFARDKRGAAETWEVWLDWWHDLLLIKGGCSEAIVNSDYERDMERYIRPLSLPDIRGFLARLRLTEEEIARNVNARLALEALMLSMPGQTSGPKTDGSP